MAKLKLDKMDFSNCMHRLEGKVGDIARFQSNIAVALYQLLLHKDKVSAKDFYRKAESIANKYSRQEMPEMHDLLLRLKEEYGFN